MRLRRLARPSLRQLQRHRAFRRALRMHRHIHRQRRCHPAAESAPPAPRAPRSPASPPAAHRCRPARSPAPASAPPRPARMGRPSKVNSAHAASGHGANERSRHCRLARCRSKAAQSMGRVKIRLGRLRIAGTFSLEHRVVPRCPHRASTPVRSACPGESPLRLSSHTLISRDIRRSHCDGMHAHLERLRPAPRCARVSSAEPPREVRRPGRRRVGA